MLRHKTQLYDLFVGRGKVLMNMMLLFGSASDRISYISAINSTVLKTRFMAMRAHGFPSARFVNRLTIF